MGCGCSTAQEGGGLSPSDIREAAQGICDRHCDDFTEDFEKAYLPKFQAAGGKTLDQEDDVNYKKCCELRLETFKDFQERADKLPEVIQASMDWELLPAIAKQLPNKEFVAKLTFKAAQAVIAKTIEAAVKSCISDIQEPPFLDKHLRALMKDIFGKHSDAFEPKVDAHIAELLKTKGKTKQDMSAEERTAFMKEATGTVDDTEVKQAIADECTERINPAIEKKLEARGVKGLKAKGVKMGVGVASKKGGAAAISALKKKKILEDKNEQRKEEAAKEGKEPVESKEIVIGAELTAEALSAIEKVKSGSVAYASLKIDEENSWETIDFDKDGGDLSDLADLEKEEGRFIVAKTGAGLVHAAFVPGKCGTKQTFLYTQFARIIPEKCDISIKITFTDGKKFEAEVGKANK